VAGVAAVVLAGGRASRLGGVDKPALRLDGLSLVARVVAAARSVGAVPIVVVGPEREGIDALWAREDPPFGGPVAALAAGLAALGGELGGSRERRAGAAAAARLESVLVLSADLRRPGAVVDALRAAEAGPDGVLLTDAGGHPQWLCGFYRLDALRAALDALGDPSGASMGRLLSELQLRRHPIADAIIADIDTPADARDAGIVLP